MERSDISDSTPNGGSAPQSAQDRRHVEVHNRQSMIAICQDEICLAVRQVLEQEGVATGHVSVVIVDDAEIRQLNRRFLQHDYATDVLSFCYAAPPELEGELIVGGERAVHVAAGKRLPARDELLWYIIHGTLHLVGYDDADASQRANMRAREEVAMRALGLMWPMDQGEESAE